MKTILVFVLTISFCEIKSQSIFSKSEILFSDSLNFLIKDTHTKNDVKKKFGKPTDIRQEKYDYDLYYKNLNLTIRFDKKTNILTSFWIDSTSKVTINNLQFLKSDSTSVMDALGAPIEKENETNGYLYNYPNKEVYIFFNKEGRLVFINVTKRKK